VKNQSGSAVLWIALGLLVFLGGWVGIYFGAHSTDEPAISAKDRYQEMIRELDTTLSNQDSLQSSVGKNSNSFSCLFSASGNCRGSGGKFLLYTGSEAASLPLSHLSKGMGLTASGDSCKAFPSELCPLRVEAAWVPICSNSYCERTNQAKVFVRALLFEQGKNLVKWEKNATFYPRIVLSEANQCARDAKVWTGVECISTDQARSLASKEETLTSASDSSANPGRTSQGEGVTNAEPEKEVVCPSSLVIQGENFPVQMISVNRGRVSAPAMNGCPAEDIFMFQCQANQDDDREGQWIQIEAQMAPNCEGDLNNVSHSQSNQLRPPTRESNRF